VASAVVIWLAPKPKAPVAAGVGGH
jgi:hypothetical protein